MKDKSKSVPGMPGDFVSQDDEGLFAFIDALRISVKARVAAEQQHGASLTDIVAQVREMVREAEGDDNKPKAFPSHAFRAISRQAVAWCVEAYRPLDLDQPSDVALPTVDESPPRRPTTAPHAVTPANRSVTPFPLSRGPT